MTTVELAPAPFDGAQPSSPTRPDLRIAGMASIGAGAIHAAVIGGHADHATLARLFVAAAAFQVAWGVAALLRPSRGVAAIGAVGNLAAVGFWAWSRRWGVSFVDGLEEAEAVGFSDLAAALLAGVVVIATTAVLVARPRSDAAPTHPLRVGFVGVTAVAVAALAAPAMAQAANHAHASGHDHGDVAGVAGDGHVHDDGHDHANEISTGETTGTTHDHGTPAAVPPKPYDPNGVIDLGGVEGVTVEQQARAESLVTMTLARLPQWADTKKAEAAGYSSIGDGLTGYEHYINWSLIEDDDMLDPDHPESLVYRIEGDTKRLVSAMYMLPKRYTLDTVPDIGGPLTQWHIHNNLCLTEGPDPRVIGLTHSDGTCSFGRTIDPVPMIHVWIVEHECGPFSALEGVGAGQVKGGETHLCDHAHGSGSA